ncbi:MAG: hypothetical protein AAF721_36925 [Myxococcota bacterium]
MRHSRLGLAFVMAFATHCSSDATPPAATSDDTGGTAAEGDTQANPDDDGADSATETGAVTEPEGPTYYGDILPLVIENCAGCHTEGGIGPFDLEDYEVAASLAEAIALQTDLRLMPPFPANNSGDCNTFKEARWLDDEAIALFAEWSSTGAREGDPTLQQPPHPELPALAGDDITALQTPENYVPVADTSGTNGLDDYQCFFVDLGVQGETRYITGFDVVPGNPAVAHHLVGFLVDPAADSGIVGSNGGVIQTLDDASPDQPGWDCFGGAGNGIIPVGIPVTWAPGAGAFNLPEGTGVAVPEGYGLVVQMHYNLANGEGDDTTSVQLSWADSVEREAINVGNDKFLAAGFTGGLEIPAGEEGWTWQWDGALSELDDRVSDWGSVEVLGILPHMHEIGRRMQIDLVSASDEQCAVFIDRWDFDWQQTFVYDTPLAANANDLLRVTCEWDSTSRDAPTMPGLGSQNEMCALAIYLAPGQ